MSEDRITEFSSRMMNILDAHRIQNVEEYVTALKTLRAETIAAVKEEDFRDTSIEFGLDERLYETYLLQTSKTYDDYKDVLIETSFIDNLDKTAREILTDKNVFIGIGAAIIVGGMAYTAVKNASPTSPLGRLRDWVGSIGQQRQAP